VARQYAEFLRQVFQKLLKLVSTHQDKAEVIRLRGEWVEIDPREWKNGFDMSVAVGLGTGNKDQMIAHLTNLLQIDEQIVGLQQGLNGPILTAEGVYEKLKRLIEAMGLKSPESYYTDPASNQQEQPEEPQVRPDERPGSHQGTDRRTGEDRGGEDRGGKGHHHRPDAASARTDGPGSARRSRSRRRKSLTCIRTMPTRPFRRSLTSMGRNSRRWALERH
jgi:hypothetical protein